MNLDCSDEPLHDGAGITADNFACKLDHLVTIRVTGSDMTPFLQGQLTNDLNTLEDNYQLGAWCNAKGRVITVVRLWRAADEIRLQFPRSLAAAVLAKMRMYILRANVELCEESEAFATAGVSGEGAIAGLRNISDGLPERGKSVTRNEVSLNLIDGARCLLNGPAESIRKTISMLPDSIPFVDTTAWLRKEILNGIPEVWPESSEKFIPQSLNLDILDAVSFSKGCYTGQEIVARTHYLGKPKQRMFPARSVTVTTDAPPPIPGTSLFLAGKSSQSCGTIVSAVSDQAGTDLLVSIKGEAFQAGACHIGSPDGQKITLTPSPYLIEFGE